MYYKLRTVKESDYENLARINKESLGYDYPTEKTKLRLKEALAQYKVIMIGVADENDNLVGYIHGEWYVVSYSEPLYNIMALAVLPECKKIGLGRMLMDEFIKKSKENGAAGIRLSSGLDRVDAHGFYEHLGFDMKKVQKNFRMKF